MAAKSKAKAKPLDGPHEATACEALKHPIRVRILEVMCEGDLSPVQFIRSGMLPPTMHFDSPEAAMSHVSYHFKVLKEAGCIALVGTKERRGATEHIYRSVALALHTDEEFNAMTFEQRRDISRSTLQMLIARADGAIIAGTFDKRPDRHLSWVPIDGDEEAWIELRDLQAESLERAYGIKAAAAARRQERREAGKDLPTIPLTFGALAFESPPTSYSDA
jgi:DNA-binding transcriptional ArsR family regulator